MDIGNVYIKAFNDEGFENVQIMDIGNKDAAKDPALIKRINKAHAVLFTGGDQFRLTSTGSAARS